MRILKAIGIILLGLFTSLLLYPILHESGHSLAAVLVGGKVYEFVLFPLPYMSCDITRIGTIGMTLIGIGGIFFPLLFTWIIHIKNFWFWLLGLYLNMICFLSFAISLYGCVMFAMQKPLINEDITQILELCPSSVWLWSIVFVGLLIGTIVQVAKTKPIRRCCEYV